MNVALVSLSNPGARIVARLLDTRLAEPGDVFLHRVVTELPQLARFDEIRVLTGEIFPRYRGLVYIAPTGVVVRALAGCLQHKTTDPAVVVVDVGGRWAVSLLSGHEGGANALAFQVANLLGAEPIVTTTTEAAKDLIVGVGCRRGAEAEAIVEAIQAGLAAAGTSLQRVRMLASAQIKAEEPGLLAAAAELGLPLRLIPCEEIVHSCRAFARSEFVESKVNLPAVAEPAALLAGRNTQLLLPKHIFHSVTVAIAREHCTSLASAPAASSTAPTEPSRPSHDAR